MEQGESIFEKYPRGDVIITYPENPIGNAAGHALGAVVKYLVPERYIPLPQEATKQEQLDNLDATLGRKIAATGRGVMALSAGIGAMLASPEVPEQSASSALFIAGSMSMAAGFYKSYIEGSGVTDVSAVHVYGSKVRGPIGWLTLPFSKRLYENIRNRQLRKKSLTAEA